MSNRIESIQSNLTVDEIVGAILDGAGYKLTAMLLKYAPVDVMAARVDRTTDTCYKLYKGCLKESMYELESYDHFLVGMYDNVHDALQNNRDRCVEMLDAAVAAGDDALARSLAEDMVGEQFLNIVLQSQMLAVIKKMLNAMTSGYDAAKQLPEFVHPADRADLLGKIRNKVHQYYGNETDDGNGAAAPGPDGQGG